MTGEEMPKLYKKTYKIGFDASVQVTAFTFSGMKLHVLSTLIFIVFLSFMGFYYPDKWFSCILKPAKLTQVGFYETNDKNKQKHGGHEFS